MFSDIALGAACVVAIAVMMTRNVWERHHDGDASASIDSLAWQEMKQHGLTRPGKTGHVVYFSDFQCPACRVLDDVLDSLVNVRTPAPTVTMLSFPLSQHQYAIDAAVLVRCANRFGIRRTVERELFRNQALIAAEGVSFSLNVVSEPVAQSVRNCAHAQAVRDSVLAEKALALRLRLPGTPAVFVNGRAMPGVPSVSDLVAALDLP